MPARGGGPPNFLFQDLGSESNSTMRAKNRRLQFSNSEDLPNSSRDTWSPATLRSTPSLLILWHFCQKTNSDKIKAGVSERSRERYDRAAKSTSPHRKRPTPNILVWHVHSEKPNKKPARSLEPRSWAALRAQSELDHRRFRVGARSHGNDSFLLRRMAQFQSRGAHPGGEWSMPKGGGRLTAPSP